MSRIRFFWWAGFVMAGKRKDWENVAWEADGATVNIEDTPFLRHWGTETIHAAEARSEMASA